MNQKYFIGPMSKEIVDVILKQDHNLFSFIPSRRQIDYNSGYVNNWNTQTFSEYVKSINPNFLIERDHSGPKQGLYEDDGLQSLNCDSLHFDMIHIDPFRFTNDLHTAIDLSCYYINYCLSINKKLFFEVSTEEAIFEMNSDALEYFLKTLYSKLSSNFDFIKYIVIQSGTKLMADKQVGNYSEQKLKKQLAICKKYGKLSKEHNGDYIDNLVIKEKFYIGLDAINIAPEFGCMQTEALLQNIDENEFEFYYNLCLKSNTWKKWFPSDFDPSNQKKQLVKVCGHYLYSNSDFKNIIKPERYEEKIKSNILKKCNDLINILK